MPGVYRRIGGCESSAVTDKFHAVTDKFYTVTDKFYTVTDKYRCRHR